MEPTKPGATPKPSKVEAIKLASEYLKTFVADELNNGSTHFTEDAATVLKFHGSYQQDDRDVRKQLKREGKEQAHQFMVRVRIVGGKLNAAQFLACDHLAQTIGNGSLRITTRQEFQLHGVLKHDLQTTIRQINEALLSTLAACGDVERNVLCCPAPLYDSIRDDLNADALAWAAHCAPRSSAYWEIWLDGEKIESLPPDASIEVPTPGDDPVEPIYGKTYLPRKFKTAFALPEDNCTDIHANDLGFLGVVVDGRLAGYNVLAGGGLGTTPSAQKTFPFLAQPLCYVDRGDVKKIGEAVLKVFRDFGNRSDRKRARLKYIIHDWGMPAFRAKVEEYLGHSLADPKPIKVTGVDDHLGWHPQGNGKLFLGIPVENGRIKDDGDFRLASGLRAFFREIPDAGATDLSAVDPAGGHRAEPPRRDRALAGGIRDRRGRADFDGSAVVDGLPGPADLRLGGHRSRTRPAGNSRPARGRAGATGPGKRTVHGTDDGMPQRLCPALQFRRRTGRPIGPHQQRRHTWTGNLHDLPGGPDCRRPAQYRVQRLCALRPGRGRARAGL